MNEYMSNKVDCSEELVNFFKALADANRLKIIGILAREPMSVEQLAAVLELHPSTVSHHLSRLTKAGLVSAWAEGYYSVYQLDTKALEGMAQRLLAREMLPAVSASVDLDAYDRQVLKNYLTPEGELKDFPTQQKKLEIILRHVVQSFEPGKRYTEKQVNEILAQFHPDTARMRRYLVDFRLMARQAGGGEYWRI